MVTDRAAGTDRSSSRLEWADDEYFSVDGVGYQTVSRRGPTAPGRLAICKSRRFIEQYEKLIERLQPRRIVELGIFGGGSTALFAQLAQPDKLVAIELRVGRILALETFIDEHDLAGTVSAHYGIDQADVAKLTEIYSEEFGAEPLDLVIDDASHMLRESRASFNLLFPRLREGGIYLLEDWSWAHNRVTLGGRFDDTAPLSALAFEILLASAYWPEAIAEVSASKGWVVVRRGPAEVDSSAFDLAGRFDALGLDMAARLAAARTATVNSPTAV